MYVTKILKIADSFRLSLHIKPIYNRLVNVSGKSAEAMVESKRSSPTVITKVDAIPKKSNNTPITPDNKKLFELKVNITESELVVVEDINEADSRTVILKTTAVLSYRPNHPSERPISCSLQSLEIFSCYLSKPDDSALSIVDPVAFLVELNNAVKLPKMAVGGLLNAVENKPSLEVCLIRYFNQGGW